MFLHRTIRFRVILQFAWRVQLYCFLLGLTVYVLYALLGWNFLAIPFLPVATIGTAVAFYVGFKNNSAYDRLWEARRIWGGITNASRMWASMALAVPAPGMDHAERKRLLYRHLAWLNSLRLQLRRSPVFSEKAYVGSAQLRIVRRLIGDTDTAAAMKEVHQTFLGDGEEPATGKANPAAALLHRQNEALIGMKRNGYLDAIEHAELSRLVLEFYNQQGAAEWIKSFPFPRQYANFSTVFVYIFITLLPFGLIADIDRLGHGTAWLVVPCTMLIAWVFNVMEQVGDASENPFDNGINDVPMTAICRNLEIEFRELLGESDLPPRLPPVEGILM